MKASTESLRQHNRSLVLSTLRRLGPVSHTEIHQWSGLSSATVSAITGELEAEGILLREVVSGRGGRGRPRVLFRQNPASAHVAAVRLTSDLIQYSLVDYGGTLKDRFEEHRNPADDDSRQFLEKIDRGLQRLCERERLARERVETISITSKGVVAPGSAKLLWSAVFGDTQLDFEAALRPNWKSRITLTNEARFTAQAAAAARQRESATFITRKVATLSLGHSIGLGIAAEEPDGQITSVAPPFGHMVHRPDGPVCRCGLTGCIEAYAGFYGILRTAFEVPGDTIPAKFVPLAEVERIADDARRGSRMAQYAFRLAGEAIGVGLARLHSLFEPMPLVITGPGLSFFDLIEPALRHHMEASLQVRFGAAPEITVMGEEANLVFEGNKQSSLADLDASILSQRVTA